MSKHKAYTVKEELLLIDRLQNGETKAKISRDTGVTESNLRDWMKEETKLRESRDCPWVRRTV